MSSPALMTITERHQRFWFFAIALLILAAGYGLRDPWPADEPRFVLIAKQMVEGGSWLFPHRGQELYPDKPPLYFWLLALSHQLIGSWRWSFLLPSLLAGLGTLWLTYDLGRRLWSQRTGLWAAIAVLSALQFVYQFKRAQIDPTLVLFTTLAFYGVCRHVLLGPHWRWFWTACFAAGLGMALKGVGFLPLLALLPWAWMQRTHWQGLAELGEKNAARWGLGALIVFATFALWFVPMLVLAVNNSDPQYQAYLDNLLYKQTATRYLDAWHHRQPLWYFLEIIGLFWLPFSLSFFWLWRDWKSAWQTRDARVWLPLSWALMVIAFFSVSPGKRDMYILPALPAMALAAAPYLSMLTMKKSFQHALFVFVLLLSVLLLSIGLLALSGQLKFVNDFVAGRGLGPEVKMLWLMLGVIGSLSIITTLYLRPVRAVTSCALLLILLWCGYGFITYPVLDASSSSRALMQRTREMAGPDMEIGLVAWKEQNLLQAIGPVQEFGFTAAEPTQLARAAAWLKIAPQQRRLLVQQTPALPCLANSQAPIVAIANRRRWLLVSTNELVGDCGLAISLIK